MLSIVKFPMDLLFAVPNCQLSLKLNNLQSQSV